MIYDALLYGLTAFVLTVIATGVVLRVLKHYHIMDNPSARSSHVLPQFRGGGWGIMIPFVLLLFVAAAEANAMAHAAWLAVAILLLMAVSWLDDMRGLSGKARFAVQIVAIICGYQAVPEGQILWGIVPQWLEVLIIGFGWLWFINLYNFMDGLDGITGQQTAFIGLGVCVLSALVIQQNSFFAMQGAILVGCGLGFLVWNWHPSKLFMGDIGSVPLGFICAYLLISLAAKGYLIAALIVPLYYVLDATITILRRAARKEKIWEPHRQHFYQQALAVVNKGHNRVVWRIIACNAVLLPCAVAAVFVGWQALIPAVAAVTALFLELRRLASLARQGLPPA